MSIGPAGEILRLAGERAAHLHEPVRRRCAKTWSSGPGRTGA